MDGRSPAARLRCPDRKLVANQEEAKTLQHIFRRYVELRAVRALKAELDAGGIRSKQRTFANGTVYGGHRLSRGVADVGATAAHGDRRPRDCSAWF